jgi:predicted DNA-binding transcriptional regulator AlpA
MPSARPDAPLAGSTDTGLAVVPDRFLTSEEVAELLRTTPRWVEDRARGDDLPSRKLGRRRVYKWSEVMAWVDAL